MIAQLGGLIGITIGNKMRKEYISNHFNKTDFIAQIVPIA